MLLVCMDPLKISHGLTKKRKVCFFFKILKKELNGSLTLQMNHMLNKLFMSIQISILVMNSILLFYVMKKVCV